MKVVEEVFGAIAPNFAPHPVPAPPLLSVPTRVVNVQPEAEILAEVMEPVDGLQKTLNTTASLTA